MTFRLFNDTNVRRTDIPTIVNNTIYPSNSIDKFNYIEEWLTTIHFTYDTVINLQQSDFNQGTYRIRQPGIYKLTENIVFNPNPSTWNGTKLTGNDWFPTLSQQTGGSQAQYPVMPYGPYHLGFFAAITVETDNVMIDLNGFTISQSMEHYLQQRFFSIIELASSPFIAGQGPSNFGPIVSPRYITIKNGKIGLSAHQAIHGNGMSYVLIENLTIFDYEQAGIALNGGENIIIRNVDIVKSSRNVLVNSRYSASRFVRSFVKQIIDSGNPSIVIRGETKTGTDILNELNAEIDSVYKNIIIDKIQPTSTTFKNTKHIIDGGIYGIVLNVLGVAVNNFLSSIEGTSGNKNILLQNININNLDSSPVEVVGLSVGESSGYGSPSQKGPVGDVFPIIQLMDENEYYVPNVLANAQCYVAKYSASKGTSNIKSYIYDDWVSPLSGTTLTPLLPENTYFVCNIDSMAHFMKGTIGLFLQGLQSSFLYDIKINDVNNDGNIGEVSKAPPDVGIYQGNICRGAAIVSSKNIDIENLSIKNISSKTSRVIGLDFINPSNSIILKNYDITELKQSNYLDSGEYPNLPPLATCFNGVDNVVNFTMIKSNKKILV